MIANRDQTEGLSERDLQIYGAVRVDGRRQADVAAEFGISQGRVSQIVRRVHQWRVSMGVAAQIERRDGQAVEEWLDALRLEKLYEESMELFRRSQQPRRKERRGKGKSGEWSMETIEHSPGNLQCLKLAARIVEMRREANQATPPSAVGLEAADERMLADRLCDLRMRAEDRGVVPPSNIGAAPLVERLLGELLGWRRYAPRREPAYDFASREVGSAGPAEPDLAQEHPSEDGRTERLGTERWGESGGQRDLRAVNAPAIINCISAKAASEEAANIDATDYSAVSYDEDPAPPPAAVGANNSAVFLREERPPQTPAAAAVGSACRAEPDRIITSSAAPGSSRQEEPTKQEEPTGEEESTEPHKPNRIERVLASGRRLPSHVRRRLEMTARLRRERLERTG